MSKGAGCSLALACLLIARIAAAGEIEELQGPSARDQIAASQGLVLVDLYAEW